MPASEFPPNRARPDGLGSLCRACQRHRSRDYRQRNPQSEAQRTLAALNGRRARARRYVWKYLSAHPCVDCGEADPVVLEFDHVGGGKEAAVARMVSDGRPLEAILREISKCEVRCANCHRRRHYRARLREDADGHEEWSDDGPDGHGSSVEADAEADAGEHRAAALEVGASVGSEVERVVREFRHVLRCSNIAAR